MSEGSQIHEDIEKFTVFTVGHEETYDEGLAKHGSKFLKQGKTGSYPGGYAVQSVEDAELLIQQHGKHRGWAIYALDADWNRDTKPSLNGWWHALIRSRPIIRKISPKNHEE